MSSVLKEKLNRIKRKSISSLNVEEDNKTIKEETTIPKEEKKDEVIEQPKENKETKPSMDDDIDETLKTPLVPIVYENRDTDAFAQSKNHAMNKIATIFEGLKEKHKRKGKKHVETTNTEGEEDEDFMKSNRTIFVRNIPHGFYEEQMAKFFGQIGTVEGVKILRNEKSGASLGLGYVVMEDPKIADMIIEKFDYYLFEEKVLRLEKAKFPNMKGFLSFQHNIVSYYRKGKWRDLIEAGEQRNKLSGYLKLQSAMSSSKRKNKKKSKGINKSEKMEKVLNK
ncbi:hypothetical protein ABK040_007915 [Willaertia magna]